MSAENDEQHDGRNGLRDAVAGLRQQLGRVGETVQPKAREFVERGAEAARSAKDNARDRLDDGVAALTMEEWREEMTEAVSDITSVLLAMDARLTALEEQLDE